MLLLRVRAAFSSHFAHITFNLPLDILANIFNYEKNKRRKKTVCECCFFFSSLRKHIWTVLPQMSRWSHFCRKNCNNIAGFFSAWIAFFFPFVSLFLSLHLTWIAFSACVFLSFAWVGIFYCYCCRLCAVLYIHATCSFCNVKIIAHTLSKV